ncbi:hypothetical protein BBJ28_00018147 [Nothophytophthora sp. Chile5]|nr:hypothetical protein BBJ28_00018147 [Nothophytophthora sp. Chile5]
MYNANVSCAILLSFVKNTCARDIEDYCKQKNIQLGIELDALDRLLLGAQGCTGAVSGATSARSMKSGSRPTSRELSSRTLHTDTDSTAATHQDGRDLQEEIAEARAKKAANESQLQVVATAAKLAKATDERGAKRVVSLLFKLQKFPTEVANATPNADLPEAEA